MNKLFLLLKSTQNPQRLFLIDSLGALLTTFSLLGILRPLEPLFGMPAPILVWLAIPAVGLAIFSAGCYWLAGSRWRLLMRIVIVVNLLYCGVTAGLVVWLHAQLTGLGIKYFVLEIGTVCVLVWFERQAVMKNFLPSK
jgi:hypothetical protein